MMMKGDDGRDSVGDGDCVRGEEGVGAVVEHGGGEFPHQRFCL
jgi:hypothetical protein